MGVLEVWRHEATKARPIPLSGLQAREEPVSRNQLELIGGAGLASNGHPLWKTSLRLARDPPRPTQIVFIVGTS